MEILGYFTAFAFLLTFSTVIRGFVLSILWGWFITRLGVMDINVAEAIGIATVVTFLTWNLAHQDSTAETERMKTLSKAGKKKLLNEKLGEAFWKVVLTALLFLSIGFVVHLFL